MQAQCYFVGHYIDVSWIFMCLQLPSIPVFIEKLVHANLINRWMVRITDLVTGEFLTRWVSYAANHTDPLWGKSTGHLWYPESMGQ